MPHNEVLDRQAIADLMARYTIGGDRGRVAELAATFLDDGVLEFPGAHLVGPVAISARLGGGGRNLGIGFVRHHLTSQLIELDGDEAAGRTYFLVISSNGLDHCGVYVDRLRRTPDGWRFAYRQVRIDWQSAASLWPPMVRRP